MDIPYGSDAAKKFTANVGLITSDGPHGPNVMACEWTHLVSYKPGVIAVCIGDGKATLENIRAKGVFGVSLTAISQNVYASIAGNNSGKNVDKIKILEELGCKFYPARRIGLKMVSGSSLNVECKLIGQAKPGDHTVFFGEALEVQVNSPESIVYHEGKFFHLGAKIDKPEGPALRKFAAVVEKHKKN